MYVDGIFWYYSDIISNNKEQSIIINLSYFEEIFSNAKSDFNQCYHNVFLSRCIVNDKYTYIEHNEELVEGEIETVRYGATKLSNLASQLEKELLSLIGKQ